MHFTTKATPTGYIDNKCHITKLKNSGTCSIGNSCLFTRDSLEADTQTHTHTDFPDKSNFQENRCESDLKSITVLLVMAIWCYAAIQPGGHTI